MKTMQSMAGLVLCTGIWYCIVGCCRPTASGVFPLNGGRFFGPSVLDRKGGWLMVTYSDLIQIGILIVSLLSLIVQINQAKK